MQIKPRLTRNPTVPEAARYLEVTESEVERLIKPEYRIEVVGRRRGAGAPRELSRTDVEDERDRRERMILLTHEKIVATVGTPDDVDTAIEIAGLRPMPASNLLDGIAANGPNNQIAIVIITEEAIALESDALIDAVKDQMEIVVLDEHFTYRWLIRECRSLIEARVEAKQNKPLKVHW